MNDHDHITEEQLNAYVDNELHDNERALLINAIAHDREISKTVTDIRQSMDQMKLAYKHPPLPAVHYLQQAEQKSAWLSVAIAATVFLAIGTLIGVLLPQQSGHVSPTFTAVNEYSPVNASDDKILIHVNSMDRNQITSALNKAEEILLHTNKTHRKVNLKLVANAEGLGILRHNSPYADRIRQLSSTHDNIKFLACGIAMENARLKEGTNIKLLPEAQKIPAALTEILDRLKEGWLYMKS